MTTRAQRDEIEAITKLLFQAGEGNDQALDQVFVAVYPRLREMAHNRRRNWSGDFTLGTTALIHEAYLKVAAGGPQFRDRGHFYAVAATAMRQILINYAEKKGAKKRGGGAVAVTLHDYDVTVDEALDEILSLDAALKKLEAMSERQGQIVECLFFAGFSIAETAEALDISPATVKRDWAVARAWLYRELKPSD